MTITSCPLIFTAATFTQSILLSAIVANDTLLRCPCTCHAPPLRFVVNSPVRTGEDVAPLRAAGRIPARTRDRRGRSPRGRLIQALAIRVLAICRYRLVDDSAAVAPIIVNSKAVAYRVVASKFWRDRSTPRWCPSHSRNTGMKFLCAMERNELAKFM